MAAGISGSMVPVSGRIEDDLYQWFISLPYENAKTNSDKLREALKELRRQHEGRHDYVSAMTWFQEATQPLRQGVAVIEREQSMHSEVMSLLIDHATAIVATLLSAAPETSEQAAQIEDQLVRRTFAMTEALLRQAVTSSAAAFDSAVVRRHSARTIELANIINPAATGGKNG